MPMVKNTYLTSINGSHVERVCLAVLAGLLLLAWIVFTIIHSGPFNHKIARMLALVSMAALMLIEIRRPWTGFYIWIAGWPFMLAARDVFALTIRPWGNMIPVFWDGASAAALTLAIFLRLEGKRLNGVLKRGPATHDSPQPIAHPRLFAICRSMLWLFAIFWLTSACIAVLTVKDPPGGWVVRPQTWHEFHVVSPLGALRPYQATISLLPCILLVLLCLNLIVDAKASKAGRFLSARIVMWLVVAGGLAVSAHVIIQHILHIQWAFDQAPPAGPFSHRNAAGAYILATFLTAMAVAPGMRGTRRWLLVPAATVFLSALYITNCRAALLTLFTIPFFALVMNPRPWRLLIATSIPLLGFYLLYYAPLPDFIGMQNPTMRRIVATAHYVRWGDWAKLTSDRHTLYLSAMQMASDDPLLGAGPGTFGMLNAIGAKYGSNHATDAIYAAHSTPLHLASETGIPIALIWVTLNLVVPTIALFRLQKHSLHALPLLGFGIINLLDTSWISSGFGNLAAALLLVFLAALSRECSSARNPAIVPPQTSSSTKPDLDPSTAS